MSAGLTIAEFAERYRLSVRAVQYQITSGRLGCQVITPRNRRIHQHHIDEDREVPSRVASTRLRWAGYTAEAKKAWELNTMDLQD